MLPVVGRVLMQVGCKKFATPPRFGSVKGLHSTDLPNKLRGSPLVSHSATGKSLTESA
jgi:hypothetical protein